MNAKSVNRIFLRVLFACFVVPFSVASGSPARSQVIIGKKDPHYCEKIEKLQPNLVVAHKMRVLGTLADLAGTPLARKPIVLRIYKSPKIQETVRQVTTDDGGKFDFGLVDSGQYRLVASWTRSFRQPDNLECKTGYECNLDIKLFPGTADGPDSVCPVR